MDEAVNQVLKDNTNRNMLFLHVLMDRVKLIGM